MKPPGKFSGYATAQGST